MALPPRIKSQVFLAAILVVHGFLLIQSFSWASKLYWQTRLATADERRLMMMPGLFRGAMQVNRQTPTDASIWFVSPYSPTDIGYFIFPRRLRWGSPFIEDREAIRRGHPKDWVLTNRSANPEEDVLELLPPLNVLKP